jgi:hypothetical protein
MEEPAYPPRLFEVPDEPVQELTPEQEEIQKKRDKAQKCKVIILQEMNLHPIYTNTNNLNKLQKRVLLEKIKLLFEEGDDNEINEKFNTISEDLISSTDYTKFPIFKRNI